MDAAAYLKRINYDGPLAPSAETLRQLHLAHLLSVPFENLSIHRHEPIVLNDDALFEKIVQRRRGGFCYELNGVFAALLRSLGFKVTMLSAEVANNEGEFGEPFDHMTLMVTLDERWLADVGFGDSFREPLRLDAREPQIQGDEAFRIEETETHLLMSRRREDGDWQPQYRFTLEPYGFADYDEMCRYHQTSPQSHFTQKRICSRATLDGRVSLSEMRLITTRGREREESELSSEPQYADVLREKFGITNRNLMMPANGSFAHRRAQRALQRQLEYQRRKAQKLRGHEPRLISGMTQASAEVRAKLQQVRPLADDARVLEVGSGAHGLIFYFGSQNAIGVDPLAHHYSSLFPGWQRKATTIGACGEALPFPDHSFDVVLCDNVVDHAESPAQIASEIVRVLAPAGVLYFTVNVHHPIYSLASGIHGIWQRFGVRYEVGPFADHTVHLTVPGARELFARQPLRIVKETTDLEVARTRAQHARARHAGDRLKRVFFKNAVYEVIAVRE